jgi:superfamily II DNA or RNA helicase
MSLALPVSAFTAIEKAARVKILNDCTVSSLGTALSPPEKIECFLVEDGEVFLPKYYSENAKMEAEEKHHELSVRTTDFKLREYQCVVEREVDAVMETYRSILLSLHCGWGKSYFAILYALKLGLQTLVTVYRVSHLDQWRDSIRAVNKNLKVQVLENKTPKEEGMDFYLILGENLAHRSCREFRGVGTFVVDECHMFCTPTSSKSFMRVQPKYCLALSATPFRTDGLDSILSLHFGYGMVKRKLHRPFNVYQLKTKFRPSVQETKTGQLDWSHVMDSQAGRVERNELIVRICQFFANRTIMILTKRVDLQGKWLFEALKERGESVDLFVRTRRTYDRDARILISTFSKAGVGFDNPKLDMLIVAGDVEEMFEQYLGRVFRRMDTVPIIVDIVDDFHVFSKHFNTRMITYLNSGGVVKSFSANFPECV